MEMDARRSYLEKHNLTRKLERGLNACLDNGAEDPIAFLASYFQNQLQTHDAVRPGHEETGGELEYPNFDHMPPAVVQRVVEESLELHSAHLSDLYELTNVLNATAPGKVTVLDFIRLLRDCGLVEETSNPRSTNLSQEVLLEQLAELGGAAGDVQEGSGGVDWHRAISLHEFAEALLRVACAVYPEEGPGPVEKLSRFFQRQLVSAVKQTFSITVGAGNQAAGKGSEGSTLFLPWSVHRPELEREWANYIQGGIAPLGAPGGSVVVLPVSESNTLHVCHFPGGSSVTLGAPEGWSDQDTGVGVALPALSIIYFEAERKLGRVEVPGGTSVILPNPESRFVASAECMVLPGQPIAADSVDRREDFIPSLPTDGHLPHGPTIMSPHGKRTLLEVPSGSQLLVPAGADRLVYVPSTTQVVTSKSAGVSAQMITLPGGSRITLPRVQQDPGGAAPEPLVMYVPYGSELYVPKVGGQLPTVMCPPGTILQGEEANLNQAKRVDLTSEAPPTLRRSDTYQLVRGIPETIRVAAGTTAYLPPALGADVPQLAQRMREVGAGASAVALAALPPALAASALSLLSSGELCEILRLAHPRTVAKVIIAHMEEKGAISESYVAALVQLPDSLLAAVCGSLPDGPEMLLAVLSAHRPSTSALLKQIETFNAALEMMSTSYGKLPIRYMVTAISNLGVEASWMLLADCPSARASFVLMRLAARNPRLAASILEYGAARASMCAGLDTGQYAHLELQRAQLLQILAASTTGEKMRKALRVLLVFLKENYHISATVVHAPTHLLVSSAQLHRQRSRSGVPLLNLADGSAAPSGGINAPINMLVSAPLLPGIAEDGQSGEEDAAGGGKGGGKSSAKKDDQSGSKKDEPEESYSEVEDTGAHAQELAATDDLEIVMNTEDVCWGFDMSGYRERLPPPQSTGLTVHMHASVLLETTLEAFSTGRPVIRGLMEVVPIATFSSGKTMVGERSALRGVWAWGAICHINKHRAAESMMDSVFTTTRTNDAPKVIECLQLVAAAMAVAVGRLRRLVDQQRSSGEMDPPQPAEPAPGKEGSKTSRKESARSSARSSGREKKSRDPSGRRRKNETEPEGPTPSEKRKWLDTYNQMKRELAARLAQDSVAENALKEIKRYRAAPLTVKKTLLAMLLLLETEGLEKEVTDNCFLWEEFSYPKKDTELWKFAKHHIVLNRQHPLYIMRLIRNASKVDDIVDAEAIDKTKRVCNIVKLMLDGIKLEDVEHASKVAGVIWQWVDTTVKSKQATIAPEEISNHQTELDALT